MIDVCALPACSAVMVPTGGIVHLTEIHSSKHQQKEKRKHKLSNLFKHYLKSSLPALESAVFQHRGFFVSVNDPETELMVFRCRRLFKW